MKKQQGFTLIELIVVIAILGILAAVALPKFVGLSSEARIAKMQGAVGAVNSAAALAHAKYLAAGSPSTNKITIENTEYTLVNGYPAVGDIATLAGLGTGYDTATTAGTIADADQSACNFTYAAAAANAAPTITTSALNSTNCK